MNNLQNKKKINGNMIAESIANFLIKYGRITLIIILAAIVITGGVLGYFAWRSSADKEVNIKMERALSAYMSVSRMQDPNQQQQGIAFASEMFRSVISEAKSKDLQLRAKYELASILFDSKNYLEASRLFADVYVKRNFYLAEPACYNRAISQIELKEYDSAIETLNTFITIYPKSYLVDEATISLADTLYFGQKKQKEALDVLKNWLDKNADNSEYAPIFQEKINLIENSIY